MFFQKTKSTSKIDSAKLLKEISNSKKIKRYTMFLIGTLLSAIAFNLFLKPNHIINGVSGLSIITEKLFNIDPSLVILIANVILLVADCIVGLENVARSCWLSAQYLMKWFPR